MIRIYDMSEVEIHITLWKFNSFSIQFQIRYIIIEIKFIYRIFIIYISKIIYTNNLTKLIFQWILSSRFM